MFDALLAIGIIIVAVSWFAVVSRWLMYEDKPKGKAFRVFSIVTIIAGFGVMVAVPTFLA